MTSHTNTTLCEQPEALRALFEKLANGQTPTMIEMMRAISDYVAFSTDSDSISEDLAELIKIRSQKKCRNCS